MFQYILFIYIQENTHNFFIHIFNILYILTQWKDLIVYQPNQDHFCYNVIQYYNKTREPTLLTYPEMSRIMTFRLHFFL